MRKRSAVLIAPVVVLGLFGLTSWIAPDVRACSCPPPQEPDDAMERADYLFAGEVVNVSGPDRDGYRSVEFAVAESWKGVEHQAITIGTPEQSSACGYAFNEGAEYLVYASENQSRTGPEIVTGICNRTEHLSLASEDVDVLGAGIRAEDLDAREQANGLNLPVLFGGVGLFVAIVVAITLLRRWR